MKLTSAEISDAFADTESARRFPPILSEAQAAELLHVAPKTLGNWRRSGRLEDTYSARGKTILYFRDRLVRKHFSPTPDWTP